MSRSKEFVHPGCRFFASCFHLGNGLFYAECIPSFERPKLPAEASTYRLIDAVELIRNLRNTMGTILKQVVKRGTVKLARSIFEVDQQLHAFFEVFHFFRRLERLKLGFFYVFVGEGFQVEFLKFLGSVRMTGHFEIPLARLISKPLVVVEHFYNLW